MRYHRLKFHISYTTGSENTTHVNELSPLDICFLKGLKPILKFDVLFIVLLFGKGKSGVF